MSWLSPGRWLAVAALLAVLALGLWLLEAHGYDRAVSEFAKQAEKVDDKREAIAAPIVVKQEAAQVQIRTVTKTIIEEVPFYVKADDCPLPAGFRVLHDAAANGEIPDAAAIADDRAVPVDTAAETVITNYGTAHETAERLRGLQEWVRAQEAAK